MGVFVPADVAGSVAEKRLALGAAGGRLATRTSDCAAAGAAQYHFQRLAGLHRCVDGLRAAVDLLNPAPGGAGAGGSRPEQRRLAGPGHAPRYGAAVALRPDWFLAADVSDL